MAADSEGAKWLGVIGRCLAYLCLKNSDSAAKGVRDQALFLEKLGLDLNDQAGVIGSTPASLRELMRRARNRKGGRGGKGKNRH